jgi:DNA-binding transcriptional MerR regulator
MTMAKTKQEQVLEFIKSTRGRGMSNKDVAAEINCDEGTVRRARKMVASHVPEKVNAQDEGEATELLKNIIEAQVEEARAFTALEYAKEGLKELLQSDRIKAARERVKDLKEDCQVASYNRSRAIQAARETHPLFDQPTGSPPGREAEKRAAAPQCSNGELATIRRMDYTLS